MKGKVERLNRESREIALLIKLHCDYYLEGVLTLPELLDEIESDYGALIVCTTLTEYLKMERSGNDDNQRPAVG